MRESLFKFTLLSYGYLKTIDGQKTTIMLSVSRTLQEYSRCVEPPEDVGVVLVAPGEPFPVRGRLAGVKASSPEEGS